MFTIVDYMVIIFGLKVKIKYTNQVFFLLNRIEICIFNSHLIDINSGIKGFHKLYFIR